MGRGYGISGSGRNGCGRSTRMFVIVIATIVIITLAAASYSIPNQPQTIAPVTDSPMLLPTQSNPTLCPTSLNTEGISDTSKPQDVENTNPSPTPVSQEVTTLAMQMMKDKGWNSYSYADRVEKAIIILLASSNCVTPKEMDVKLRKNFDALIISDKINHGEYAAADKTVYLNTEIGSVNTIVHELTHSVSGFSEYNRNPKNIINGKGWCFSSQDTDYLATSECSHRLLEGLTDFLGNRNLQDTSIATAGNELDGIPVALKFYAIDGPSYPFEQGLSMLFYYAVGSRDVEQAYYGDQEASEKFIAEFADRYGSETLEKLVQMIDENTHYLGYVNSYTSQEQRNGLEKIRQYIFQLLDLMKLRSDNLSSKDEIDAFIHDIECFESLNVNIDDKEFTNKVENQILQLKNKSNEMQ